MAAIKNPKFVKKLKNGEPLSPNPIREEQKFGDMKAGTIFNDGYRNFIKLNPVYGSGLIRQHFHRSPNMPEGFKSSDLPFNSVDFDGNPANCPQWLEFTLGMIAK